MIRKDLVAAAARPLVLSILAGGESYGYEIIQRIKELSEGEMQWKDGMLYPVLHRLEQQGLIEAEWRVMESGRKRKYYFLKKEGHEAIAAEKQQWKIVHGALLKVWEAEPCLN